MRNLGKNGFYGLSGFSFEQVELLENVKTQLKEKNIKEMDKEFYHVKNTLITTYGYRKDYRFIPVVQFYDNGSVHVFGIGSFNFASKDTHLLYQFLIKKVTILVVSQALKMSLCLENNIVLLDDDIKDLSADAYIIVPDNSTTPSEWIVGDSCSVTGDDIKLFVENFYTVYGKKNNDTYKILYANSKNISWEKIDRDIFKEYQDYYTPNK